ncbi:hypothetical protein CEXT_588751 [Caerostris extrusa]|uniref:Granulin n=1 Tax=Caerostris extrusa TaxID=172846 RepID=A0AAV4TQD1_CAEEX|nr:hypothetical protein CEXT_588751 [Caerostris extrusa]
MKVFLLITILPWLVAADVLCPDRITTCSGAKSCCEFDGFYTCCDTTTGEIDGHLLPVDSKLIDSNLTLTIQSAPGFDKQCPSGRYCPLNLACCGIYCCEMGGSCCDNRGCCGSFAPCCGTGCCRSLQSCCGGQGCCQVLSKCCGNWCCPSKSRCGTRRNTCYNSSVGLVPTIALISLLIGACFATKSNLQ